MWFSAIIKRKKFHRKNTKINVSRGAWRKKSVSQVSEAVFELVIDKNYFNKTKANETKHNFYDMVFYHSNKKI